MINAYKSRIKFNGVKVNNFRQGIQKKWSRCKTCVTSHIGIGPGFYNIRQHYYIVL